MSKHKRMEYTVITFETPQTIIIRYRELCAAARTIQMYRTLALHRRSPAMKHGFDSWKLYHTIATQSHKDVCAFRTKMALKRFKRRSGVPYRTRMSMRRVAALVIGEYYMQYRQRCTAPRMYKMQVLLNRRENSFWNMVATMFQNALI